MRVIRFVLLSSLLLGVTACRGFVFPWNSTPGPGAPSESKGVVPEEAHQIRVEFQAIVYDGRSLRGRLLVSPGDGNIRLDKRLIESTVLSTTGVKDCSTDKPIEFMVMDVLAKPPRDEDVLMLAPGHWYGRDIHVPLMAEAPGRPPGPDCIDADFVFHTLGEATASLHVRATKTVPPERGEPTSNAGPPPDAGR